MNNDAIATLAADLFLGLMTDHRDLADDLNIAHDHDLTALLRDFRDDFAAAPNADLADARFDDTLINLTALIILDRLAPMITPSAMRIQRAYAGA